MVFICLWVTVTSLDANERTSKANYACPETKGLDAPIVTFGIISKGPNNDMTLEILDYLKGEGVEQDLESSPKTVRFDGEYSEKCQTPEEGESVVAYMDSSMKVLRIAIPTVESISKYNKMIISNKRRTQMYGCQLWRRVRNNYLLRNTKGNLYFALLQSRLQSSAWI